MQNFFDMLKSKYEKEKIEFEVSEEKMRFKSKGLLEVMTGSKLQG